MREAVGYEGKVVDCVSEARCGAGRELGACLLAGLIGSKAGEPYLWDGSVGDVRRQRGRGGHRVLRAYRRRGWL